MVRDFAFISFDIVGHSAEPDLQRQIDRIRGLNEIVSDLLSAITPDTVVWASGGDGGHVAIAGADWPEKAVGLIGKLRDWSVAAGVRLRVTAHYGPVDSFTGSGGITQLVGPGINLAGRLLEYGDQERVVVSRQFVDASANVGYNRASVEFHESRMVQLKHFASQDILLLSLREHFRSTWDSLVASDRSLLAEASNQQRYWDVVYYARRLMDVDVNDQDADNALISLPDHGLSYKESGSGLQRLNPLFGSMDRYSRAEFIKASQLVERDRNEILFRAGDSGNTMFVVLRGEVAVVPLSGAVSDDLPPPTIQIGVGAIVGELAFALHRQRTATLQCLTRTTLLSFSPQAVEAAAETRTMLRQAMERFVKSRILEHVCNNVDYLIGRNRSGPLSGIMEPWELLIDNSTLLTYSAASKRRISQDDAELQPPGLSILVSGQVRDTRQQDWFLDGTELPIVFAELPGDAVTEPRTLELISDVIVLRIGPEGFTNRRIRPTVFQNLIAAVRAAISEQRRDPPPQPSRIATPVTGTVKILFLAANPSTTTPLQLDHEVREIEKELQRARERHRLELITKWAVRADDLPQYLLEYQPHIVHFSGHGTETSELILEDGQGRPRPLSQTTLLRLFTTLKDNIRVVVLNSCFSRVQAEAITSTIDCAIGMDKEIGDRASVMFAASFYRALGFGRSVETAFELGKIALADERLPEETTPVLLAAPGVNVSELCLIARAT
jgi:hypothetical protein